MCTDIFHQSFRFSLFTHISTIFPHLFMSAYLRVGFMFFLPSWFNRFNLKPHMLVNDDVIIIIFFIKDFMCLKHLCLLLFPHKLKIPSLKCYHTFSGKLLLMVLMFTFLVVYMSQINIQSTCFLEIKRDVWSLSQINIQSNCLLENKRDVI